MTKITFNRPEEFDALSYLEQAIATLPRKFSFNILLKTDLITAQDTVSHVFGILETQSNQVLFQGSVDDLAWFAGQLASLPFEFVIEKPLELRSVIQEHARKLIQLTK